MSLRPIYPFSSKKHMLKSHSSRLDPNGILDIFKKEIARNQISFQSDKHTIQI